MLEFLQSIMPLVDMGSLYFLVIGISIIVFSGLISDVMGKGKSLIISILFTIVPIFIIIDHFTGVETMRIVVTILVVSCIIPLSITFLITWVLTNNKISFVRLSYVSFVGWWLSILTIELLRIVSGWGEFNSALAIISMIIFYSLLTGILGSIISKFIIDVLEVYRPERSIRLD